MQRRTPEYIECARSIMRDHFEDLPPDFNVRVLAQRMPEHKPSMITNALRHLETTGVVHAPGDKTYDGATGRRKVAVMVWRKGPNAGPRAIARRGGNTHVPPSEALARLGLPSPHDKAKELQLCMANEIPLENIAGAGEHPVYYVPRAWLDERAPAPADPDQSAEPNTTSSEGLPADPLFTLLYEVVTLLRTLVSRTGPGQYRLPI
ncbi:hypothetical protein QTN24_15765 [Cupriavidus sp. SZY C1]|uniref:hypothetical protein n=1 Tax=Cupriavidus sp. SZY C1 TaxID=3055037 RepID=UPI0028B3543D|nr:hypothetical protein [Cupriavidus sp. SZY C1]MDT6962955.1 hypothetical protein [Cupriavidus sp. SZY C1]